MDKIWLVLVCLSLGSLCVMLFRFSKITLTQKVWINLIFYVVVVAINYASAMGLITGFAQKDISMKYQTSITPAGFAFSIWGVIYVLLLASIIYMIKRKENLGEQINKISFWLWAMFVFNILWNIIFTYGLIGYSVIIIIMYWISLVKICCYLKDDFGLMSISFGIHLGWLTAATIVNIAAALVGIGWEPLINEGNMWYMAFLIIGIVAGALLLGYTNNMFIPLAMAWAYFGILSDIQTLSNLKIVSIIGVALFLVMLGFGIIRKMKLRNS